MSSVIDQTRVFINNVTSTDLLAVAQFWDWLYGGGLSGKSVGLRRYSDRANDYSAANLMMPRGASSTAISRKVRDVATRPGQIRSSCRIPGTSIRTSQACILGGVTEPHYALGPKTKGSKTDIKRIDESAKYSGSGASWRSHAMEWVRWRAMVSYAKGHKEIRSRSILC